MAENQNKCTGNCMVCTIFQRQYCASQLAYSNMRMLEQIEQEIVILKGVIRQVGEKIEAMQNNEALLFDPTNSGASVSETSETAQKGDGAEE